MQPAASDETLLYGGLRAAGMELALPLAALREVLPCTALAPLPCALPALRGALPVRGVMVPVLDLALLLAPAAEAAPAAGCVVLVVHEGRLLGLLAEGVSGIFEAAAEGRIAARAAADGAAATHSFSAFAGSVRRAGSDRLHQLLSLQALATLTGVPWLDDPEPARQAGTPRTAGGAAAAAAAQVPLMLLRSGRNSLAIDAMLVHATVWSPTVRPSPLAHGDCLGVIDFQGRSVPALDLAACVGFEPLAAGRARQALIVRRPEGLVALLVEQVADIVRVAAERVAAVPAFALRRPAMIRGVLSAESLADAQVVGADSRQRDYLVVESRALLDAPDLVALAASNGGVESTARGGPAEPGRSAAGPALITFRLPAEMAVPIGDVDEILSYGTHDAAFGADHVLRRIQVLRGRTIPVLCLARLMGGTVERVDASAAVLVTACDGPWVGFAVPHLQSIETLAWDARLPTLGAAGGDALATVLATPRVVTVGSGEHQRTMRCLDLRALAAALLSSDTLRQAA